MRTNDKKTRGEKDPNEYYDSPGFPPRTGDQSQPGIQNQLGVQSAKPDAKAAPDTEALCTSNDAITPSNADPGAKAAPDTEAICSSSETRTSSNADPGARPSADPEDPDAYNVFEDLIWSQDDEEIDFPPPIPITLETPPPYVSESVGAESNGAAGVPPAMLPALDGKAKSPGNGAAGVPPALLPALNGKAKSPRNGAAGVPPAMLPALDSKAKSPGHTGTCDAPYSTPRDGAAGVPPAKTNGAAGVPPAMLPALDSKAKSPGHTGTCDAPCEAENSAAPLPPKPVATKPEPAFLVAMRKGNVDEHLNPVDFCAFLGWLGYQRWLGDGSCELILPEGCVLKRVSLLSAKEHVESLIAGYDFLQAVKDKVFRRLKEFFIARNLTSLPEFEGEILTDSRDRCYKPYLNCVVEVTPEGCSRLWYSKLEKYVWKSDIIPRVFVDSGSWQSGIYFRFTQNQCTDPSRKGPDGKPFYDFERHRAYLASLGYNLHDFKRRLQPCLTIYSDATEGDRERNGGSGKSLIIQFLSAMQGSGADAAHRIVTETGENLKRDYNHNFDQVTSHTRVVVIDDLDTRRFPLESVYSWVTVGMRVNKKGLESRFLKFEDAPKCVVTSNNPVSGTRDSDLRRRMDVQLFRYYNASHKPVDDFGRGFFNEGFSQEDWAQFDSFAIACIQISLRYNVASVGLPPYENNVLEASLELEIGDDLVEYLDRHVLASVQAEGRCKLDARNIKSSYEDDYGVKRKESSRRFNSRLKRYGELRRMECDMTNSGGVYWVTFSRPG